MSRTAKSGPPPDPRPAPPPEPRRWPRPALLAGMPATMVLRFVPLGRPTSISLVDAVRVPAHRVTAPSGP